MHSHTAKRLQFTSRVSEHAATEHDVAAKEVASLLDKGVISLVDHEEGEFISNIFIREKSTPGSYRTNLNVKLLNEEIEKIHFKMDTLQSVLALVEPRDWMISIDFTDAYYSIPIAKHHRKLLRFQFDGKLLSCLPSRVSSRYAPTAIQDPN